VCDLHERTSSEQAGFTNFTIRRLALSWGC
jgi:hypothetical protein